MDSLAALAIRCRRYVKCWATWNLSKTILPSASGRCARTEATYGSHMSIATAPMPLICSGVRVSHQGEIALTLSKGFFIDTNLTDGLRFASLHSTLHRPLHDAVNLVPTEPQHLGHGFLAGRLQPLDRQQFKQRCESARRLRPWHLHHAHSMIAARAARRLGVQ